MRRTLLLLLASPLVLCFTVSARTWHINPDGTGDALTIQAGIDSAAVGDTVLLADGTYTGDSNCDLDYSGKAIVVRSEGGVPDVCIIDGGGSHRGFVFENGEDSLSVLEGITIRNSWGPFGGGIHCFYASPTIRHCFFLENSAINGGGVSLISSSSTLTDCMFATNSAETGGAVFMGPSSADIVSCSFQSNQANVDGGAIYCEDEGSLITGCNFSANTAMSCGGAVCFEHTEPTVSECEFTGNQAPDGGAVYCGLGEAYYDFTRSVFSENTAQCGGALFCDHGSSVSVDGCTFYGNCASFGSGIFFFDTYLPSSLDNTIIAAGRRGAGVFCEMPGSLPLLSCCDVHGNPGGDWVGCIEAQYGINGNISEDPLFCDPVNGDFEIDCSSPCADGYGCGLIGAYGVGCGASAVRTTSWSTIKSTYR